MNPTDHASDSSSSDTPASDHFETAECDRGETAPPREEALPRRHAVVPPGRLNPPKAVAIPLILLSVLGLAAFLFFARSVMIPLVLAVLASMVLRPIFTWIRQLHVPSPLAAGLVLGLFLITTATGFTYLGRPAIAWLNNAPAHLQQIRERAHQLLGPAARISEAVTNITDLAGGKQNGKNPPTVSVKDGHVASTVFTWTGSVVTGAIETIALVFLLLSTDDLFLHKIVRIMPTLEDKRRAVIISKEIQHSISTYLFSVTVINIVLGAAVGTGLYFLGVPNAAVWAAVVAILNYIPYFGPVAGIVILAMAGLLTFNNLLPALLAPAWYLLLHLIEANVITPLILGQRFTLNPVVIFLSLIFGMWLWGIIGALIAVPLLMSAKIICEEIPTLGWINELLGR